MLSTPLNAPLAPRVCMAHVLGQGYGGHLWVQKWSRLTLPKFLLHYLGCSNKFNHVQLCWTHTSPCNFPKARYIGNFLGPAMRTRGPRGMRQGVVCLSSDRGRLLGQGYRGAGG